MQAKAARASDLWWDVDESTEHATLGDQVADTLWMTRVEPFEHTARLVADRLRIAVEA